MVCGLSDGHLKKLGAKTIPRLLMVILVNG